MIRHVFLWSFVAEADASRGLALLNQLPDAIPEIRAWAVGPHQGAKGEHALDYGLVCDFDSATDLERYNTHPLHLKVIEAMSAMIAAQATTDILLGR